MNHELGMKNSPANGGKTLTPKPSTRNAQKGFTLVEMIVALGFFTTIMLVVISVLTVVSGANEKARTTRIVIDNLNFAVENMARTMRVGSVYHCCDLTPDLNIAQDCDTSPGGISECADTGMSSIAFNDIQKGGITAFRIGGGGGFIERANNCTASGCPSANWKRLTAPEIDVHRLCFYVSGSGETDGKQAQIFMVASGVAGKGDIQTDFDIQTTVTQRLADS